MEAILRGVIAHEGEAPFLSEMSGEHKAVSLQGFLEGSFVSQIQLLVWSPRKLVLKSLS